MTTHLYEIDAPGSELHGEAFEVQDVSRTNADKRAAARIVDTFSLSTRRDARAVHVAVYPDRRALAKAEESGLRLTSSDAARRAEDVACAEDRADVADERAARAERASW